MNRFNIISINRFRFFYSFQSLLFVIFLLGLFVPHQLSAKSLKNVVDEGYCKIPKDFIKKPPILDNESITINISLFVIDIMDIRDISQTYEADVLFHYSWRDHRLSKDSIGRSLEHCELKLNEVWHPEIVEVNIKNVSKFFGEIAVVVDENGNLNYRQRYVGEFITNLEYKDFPFDRQILKFTLAATGIDADNINFDIDKENITIRSNISIEGWAVSILKPLVSMEFIKTQNRYVPILDFRLLADRDENYYIWKVIVPLCLIVLMAWAVFWINPEAIGPQIGLSTATIFTLIAYRFSLGQNLPKVSYFTRIDKFVFFTTILVFIALGIAVLTSRIASEGNLHRALKIEKISRIVYLLVLVAIIFFTLWL